MLSVVLSFLSLFLKNLDLMINQKGEKVKNMAQEASEAVKNKLGINNDNNNEYKNKNPLDKKNPNNTTSPSMPGHPPSDI